MTKDPENYEDVSVYGLDYEVELYRPADRVRLLVKPGMTGLWQATERNQVGMREMFELDRRYVRER